MTQRSTETVQHGIWIDQQRLAEAGLEGPVEVVVGPGEIHIRPAAPEQPAKDPLLDLVGALSGLAISGQQIEQDLYAAEPAHP